MMLFMAGEELDPESGEPHLYCAICNLAFLQINRDNGVGTDDRYPTLDLEYVR